MLVLEKNVPGQGQVAGLDLARNIAEIAKGIMAVRGRGLIALEKGDTRAVRHELERLELVCDDLLKCLVPSA